MNFAPLRSPTWCELGLGLVCGARSYDTWENGALSSGKRGLCGRAHRRNRHPQTKETPPMTTIGFGIVGCGMIARFHAQAIKELPNARLVALCSRNQANAAKV